MKLKLLALILALQCAWILGTTFQQERALRVGNVILLETAPVDPRDLLRGDYVILNYKISTLPRRIFNSLPDESLTPGRKVYVALEQTGDFHTAVRADTVPFEAGAGQVLVVGQVRSRAWGDNSVRVDYGLERYYVTEGTGTPTGKLTVQASVSKSGHAIIKQVFIDGKPYAEVMKR